MLQSKVLVSSIFSVLGIIALGGCEPEDFEELLTHLSDAVDNADGEDWDDTESADPVIRDSDIRDTEIRDTESGGEPVFAGYEVGECNGAPAAGAERPVESDSDAERPVDTDSGPGTYIITRGDSVTLVDEDVPVNCCADLVVRVDPQRSLIAVTEHEIVGEDGLCRCMCTRDVTVFIEGLAPGIHLLTLQRISADGTVTDVDSFRFECVETPDEWGYRGVTCVN